MVCTIRSRRSRPARVGLVLVIVLVSFSLIPAVAEVPADAPPAPLTVPDPEEVVLRVDVPGVGEKGGSAVRVGVEASFAERSGVSSEDVTVLVSVGGGVAIWRWGRLTGQGRIM